MRLASHQLRAILFRWGGGLLRLTACRPRVSLFLLEPEAVVLLFTRSVKEPSWQTLMNAGVKLRNAPG
jgi:hypothetical protein